MGMRLDPCNERIIKAAVVVQVAVEAEAEAAETKQDDEKALLSEMANNQPMEEK